MFGDMLFTEAWKTWYTIQAAIHTNSLPFFHTSEM